MPLTSWQQAREQGSALCAACAADECHAVCRHRDLRRSKGSSESSSACCRLCAGALRSTDPDRVVLKKAVLTGFPVKVHKKKAVVRWMFHSPEDVRWFRPVDLWTKHGRQGRIKVKRRVVLTHLSWGLVITEVVASSAPYAADDDGLCCEHRLCACDSADGWTAYAVNTAYDLTGPWLDVIDLVLMCRSQWALTAR